MPERILVVNDDASSREFLSMALADEGYEVLTAEDGEVGLNCIRTFLPHLILLDMRMPNVDGESFLEQYREITGRKVPIIACSAASNLEWNLEELGADDFLAFPIELTDLFACVQKHLEHKRVSD